MGYVSKNWSLPQDSPALFTVRSAASALLTSSLRPAATSLKASGDTPLVSIPTIYSHDNAPLGPGKGGLEVELQEPREQAGPESDWGIRGVPHEVPTRKPKGFSLEH